MEYENKTFKNTLFLYFSNIFPNVECLRVQVGFCFYDLYLHLVYCINLNIQSNSNTLYIELRIFIKTRSCCRVTQNQICLQGYSKLDLVTGLLKTRSSYRVTQNQICLQGYSKLDLVAGLLKTRSCYRVTQSQIYLLFTQNQIDLQGYSKLDFVTGLLKTIFYIGNNTCRKL